MPIYGSKKTRVMLRSILPSSKRKTARAKRATIHRRERRFRTEQLNLITGYDDAMEFERYDERTPASVDLHEMVKERRDNDKLAHFERWAVQITEHLGDDPVERYAYIKRLLPDNLIGRHAMTHVDFLDEFKIPVEHKPFYFVRVPPRAETRRTLAEELTDALEVVVRDARVGELNHLIKKHWRFWRGHAQSIFVSYRDTRLVTLRCAACQHPRCFHGAHDIGALVHWYLRTDIPVISVGDLDIVPPSLRDRIKTTVSSHEHRKALLRALHTMGLSDHDDALSRWI